MLSRSCIFYVLAILLLTTSPLLAATPLLQEGKTTLYQRVVSHPGASLLAGPQANAQVVQAAVKPFSVFYVYAREGAWVQVGAASNQASGWIKAQALTDWPQAMTLLFTDRTGRMPVLFFKDEASLMNICRADDMQARLNKLMQQVAQPAGQDMSALPILATEPADTQGAVARSRFYLMPIQDMKDPFEGTKFLQVASIDPGNTKADNNGNTPDAKMRTAIVFVIDTTISMGPYIEQSLNVVRQTYDSIEKDKLGDNVGIAIVAFRNSTAASPGLEYDTRVVSDFKTVNNRQELETALAAVREAGSSSHSFNEDAMSGIKTAIDKLSWQNYNSKVMVLISDAGPLPAADKYLSSRLDSTEMLDYARSKNIWITVLHVKTPAGAQNHAYAEKAYRALTQLSDNSSSYIAIPAPNAKQGAQSFAKAAQALAASLTKVVKATANNQMLAKPSDNQSAKPEDQAAHIGQSIGYAMQLDFLGAKRQNQAPSLVTAWIADMDLLRLADGKNTHTVEVAVLLTKNQLSDLQKQLKIIIDEAERVKRTDAKDFFQSILSASASIARDPSRFSRNPGQNLQQMGVLGEFLEGLPYKSDVMLLTEDDWHRMSVGQQTAFINRLRSRIARYEQYDKDVAGWESFGSPNSGDWVYRVPLNMLP